MEHFKLKLGRASIEHRRPSINVRSLLPSTKCVTKETISPSANSESFRAKMRNTPTYFPILTTFNLVANCVHFQIKWRKARHFDARTVDSFVLKRDWGSPGCNYPNGFKNTTNVYSIHLELRMAVPCQISTGRWKYVNPCLYFLGIPDQRTVYVKRQMRPRWTYVRRSSVTPDLIASTSLRDQWFNFMSVRQWVGVHRSLESRSHDDVIKWKHFPRYWPFVRGIHRSPVNSPHKGQWRGALIFSLISAGKQSRRWWFETPSRS